MSFRRPFSVMLVVVACTALVLCIDGDVRILWRALALSWDRPATQAQDELSVQSSLHTDPEREAQQAVLPLHDGGRQHVPRTALDRPRSACAPCLTRSPPSA